MATAAAILVSRPRPSTLMACAISLKAAYSLVAIAVVVVDEEKAAAPQTERPVQALAWKSAVGPQI